MSKHLTVEEINELKPTLKNPLIAKSIDDFYKHFKGNDNRDKLAEIKIISIVKGNQVIINTSNNPDKPEFDLMHVDYLGHYESVIAKQKVTLYECFDQNGEIRLTNKEGNEINFCEDTGDYISFPSPLMSKCFKRKTGRLFEFNLMTKELTPVQDQI